MELELLVRLMQMQTFAGTNSSQVKEGRGIKEQNFALVLAAIMGGSKGGAAIPSSYRVDASPGIKSGTGVQKRVDGNKDHLSREGIEVMVDKVSAKYGLDPALLKAVIKAESNFNPLALSSAGAMGLMQLMPATARSLGVKNSYDALENLEGGAKYLKSLLNRFKGNVNMALAAYNAGPGTVEKYGGVPPFRETVSYIQKVKSMVKNFNE